MTWMPSFLSSRSDVEYTGYDIVEANINNHREKFRDTDWKFEVHDIVTDPINSSYDLILSRHTTMHLSIREGFIIFTSEKVWINPERGGEVPPSPDFFLKPLLGLYWSPEI